MTKLFDEFQTFRKILCLCPCCGDLVRVSDLRLFSKGKVAKTWLDEYEQKSRAMDKKEERFEDKEEDLRRKSIEKGRKEAEKAVKKAINPALKSLKFDPFDVKAILNPVDFVVFKGMNKKDTISDIVMLSEKIKNSQLNAMRKQVKNAITQKKYEWQVARIDPKGNIQFE